MLLIVVNTLLLFFFLYIAASTVYLVVIAVAGKFVGGKRYGIHPVKKRIAVLIPSYREDNIIVDTAVKAVSHDYDRERFEVIVVADQLQPQTVQKLKQVVRVIEVKFERSMKSRSIHAALDILSKEDFEILVILDADNIMGQGCLEKINDAFHRGCMAVQCHRTAKNKETAVALLDAISEEININLFRRGPAVLGLSAAPIGSGMAFNMQLVNEIFSLPHILNNPGEDREIDMQLIKKRVDMEFINDAYVYDEKVSSSEVFEKQRTRWLEAQVNHLRRFFHADMRNTPLTAPYMNKFIQTILLPRLLFLVVFAIIFIFLVIGLLFDTRLLFPHPLFWWSCMILYFFTLFISIPKQFYNGNTLRAIAHIPVLMFSMIRALLKMKKNRSEFLHTPKNVIVK
jgi:cellulose synthase/poly-beta-1,6-N-acetylglucosamine synthase-like glycosyltransferase